MAEQRGVPFIINIAAAPQITEQGYKFVFRNFPVASELVKNGLALNDACGTICGAFGTAQRDRTQAHQPKAQ